MAAPRAIGKFQVMDTLGKGAHSSILHIRCQSDGRQYVLKIVPIEDKDDRKYYDQAEHEFRVGQMLDHANLIKIFAFEPQRDWLFRVKKVQLLIEYVNGKTLDTVPALSVPRLVQVFHRVAAGLAHMHRRGVYHAALKPNNIILGKGGGGKIIDYGLAWIKGEAKDPPQGTPQYTPLDQSKHTSANARNDTYHDR